MISHVLVQLAKSLSFDSEMDNVCLPITLVRILTIENPYTAR
jgi:hypothetical protein